jgi:pimeloyl-ACP methyl ester carboxylesterase
LTRSGRRRAVALAASALALLLLALAFEERPDPRVGRWLERADLSPRERVLAGHRIRFVRAGEGPSLVLIHGLGSSLHTWKALVPRLATAYDVIALDLPGFGASEQPADLSFADLVAVIPALLDDLGLERAGLVGNSLGGGTAAAVAAAWPERVSALALIDAAGFQQGPVDTPAVFRLATADPTGLLARLPLRRLLVRLALRQVFHDDALVTDDRVEEYLAPMLRPGAIGSLRSLLSMPPSEMERLRRGLREIRAPALIAWGREDAWIPVAHAERFRQAIPSARVELLEGCGHMPQEECPEALLRVLLPFLAEHLGAAAQLQNRAGAAVAPRSRLEP